MDRHFEHDLEFLEKGTLRMAAMVEAMVADSMRSLADRRPALAREVVERDQEVDDTELSLDEKCLDLLVLRGPKARDLRFVVAAMRIISDLERVGDAAKNIAAAAEKLADAPPLRQGRDLPRLADLAISMLRDGLSSLVGRDTGLAREVCLRDNEADALYDEIFEELVSAMSARAEVVPQALQLVLVARNLERVADHATNIAEDVIFFLEAEDVRHQLAKSTTPTPG